MNTLPSKYKEVLKERRERRREKKISSLPSYDPKRREDDWKLVESLRVVESFDTGRETLSLLKTGEEVTHLHINNYTTGRHSVIIPVECLSYVLQHSAYKDEILGSWEDEH